MPRNGPDQLDGWNSYAPIFKALIERVKPRVIIEVGSWVGASAIHMAKLAPDARIWCVDTFEGSREHQSSELPRFADGKSALFMQFSANVLAAQLQDRVIPVVSRSVDAVSLLAENGIVADLIYIDGSHEYPDVVADLAAYWPLLRPGGIMFGDDWIEWHATVGRAVSEFPHAKAVVDGNHWYMEKTA